MKTNDPSFENGFRPAEPRDAAAILIVSDGEVLWARRNPAIKFLGGFHAFPGGKTDSNDHCIEVKNCIDSELSANIACAVREVFEEVGVLLTRGGDKLTKGQRASLHDDLISGRSSFAEILEQWGLWIDADDFIYTGFWTTPQFSPVRFKTRFFIAQHPRKQVPYAAISELEKIEFIAPEAALERWRRSEVLITPPVLIHLQELARDGEIGQNSAERLRILSRQTDGNIDYIELNPRTTCFPLRTKTLPPATHTNCFIVGSRRFVVIDAATPFEDEQQKLFELVDRLIVNGGECFAIVVSHLHNDHFGGEAALQRHLSDKFAIDVPIAGHRITAEDLSGKVAFQRFLSDGEILYLADADGLPFELDILHTPGHARGHLAFYDRELGFLLPSDNVVGTGTVVIAPPQGDMAAYLESLHRMRDLPGLRFLAGSHGAAVFDARGRIDQYIRHRLSRETQIAAILDSGIVEPESIARVVYPDLAPELFRLAIASVSAHLAKINDDRRQGA